VFFFHISSGPDDTNNFLALAFGIFVVGLIIFGSMLIMTNLNANMTPMEHMLQTRH
jgi:cytochrome o ubiquinol oxidase operon protein cyoD